VLSQAFNHNQYGYLKPILPARLLTYPRERPSKFTQLQRLSIILEVDQFDLDEPQDAAESLTHTSLSTIVNWIKEVVVADNIQEFHLSLTSPWDRRPNHFQIPGIERCIVPPLLDLESYLVHEDRAEPLRVKISMRPTERGALEYIRARLEKFNKLSTLEVEEKGESVLYST
jgi:hypothetical protein